MTTPERLPLRQRTGLLGLVTRQWPWVLTVGLVAVGLVLVVLRLWRPGCVVVGVGTALGGLLRWRLPDPGILAVRRRRWDVPFYLLLGAGIVVFALWVPNPV
ncbi:MAG: DUF3017 domain-containing protein [Propionibacteriaceae bacterium]|jgi:hypothetical protein|nr:DUF3017 domain-containing protein [Propionibacteriaceae bacterium]